MNKNIDAFSEEVARLIPFLARGMMQRQRDLILHGTISMPQYLVLSLLETEGPMMMKDIACAMHISLPAATGLITKLVRMNAVTRVHDTNDRRIIRITLNKSGKRTVRTVTTQRRKALGEVFSKLTKHERTAYLRILRKIIRILYPESGKK